jgi:uncharacterized protein (DUF2147 family)
MRQGLLAIAVAAAMAYVSSGARAQTADDAFGLWLDPSTGGYLEVYKCGENLCAKIAKVTKDGVKDENNVDPAKRDRLLLGLVIIENAYRDGDAAWAGSVYDRTSGKTYSGGVTVKGKDEIEIKGCLMGVICRGQKLTRAK